MNYQALITALREHAKTIQSYTNGLTLEQARWKPAPESWSVLEVINHLYDEEINDFRLRLEYILFHPGEEWPPNRPQEWVTERSYNTRELEPSIQNFLDERAKSLEWLASLSSVDWETSGQAPWGEQFPAGGMFVSWVAHDVLHLRQLAELHFELVKQSAEGYDVGYAGDW